MLIHQFLFISIQQKKQKLKIYPKKPSKPTQMTNKQKAPPLITSAHLNGE
jgi:hypothetical protein